MGRPRNKTELEESVELMKVLRGLASQLQTRSTEIQMLVGETPTPITSKLTDRPLCVGEAMFEVQLWTYQVQERLMHIGNALREMDNKEPLGPTPSQSAFGSSWKALRREVIAEIQAEEEL